MEIVDKLITELLELRADALPRPPSLDDFLEHLIVLRKDPAAADSVGIVISKGSAAENVDIGYRVLFSLDNGRWFKVPGTDFSVWLTLDSSVSLVLDKGEFEDVD